MSVDDFQTKHSSVMDCVLRSAVAETTKLFQTMADELRAEISKLQQENEALRTKQEQFEKEKAQVPVNTKEPLTGLGDKRDMATQCDLVPAVPTVTLVVNQGETQRDVSLHNQKEQWRYEDITVPHTQAGSQMPVKQEPVVKEEADEPNLDCGQVSQPTSASGAYGPTGLHIKQEVSTEGLSLLRTVTPEHPSLEMTRGPHVKSQSPELMHSRATVTDLEEESDTNIKILEVGTITSAEHSPVDAQQTIEKEQRQREPEMSLTDQIGATVQQSVYRIGQELAESSPCDQDMAPEALKLSRVEDESSSEQICEKTGQAPKTARILLSSKVSSSITSQAAQREGNASESQKRSTEAEILPPAKKDSTATNPPQTPSCEASRRCTSVTLQDAMLLVEAMNRSTAENAPPSQGPRVNEIHTVDEIPARSPMPQLPILMDTLPVTTLSISTLSKGEKAKAATKTTDAALKAPWVRVRVGGVHPKPQHVVVPSSPTILAAPLSSATQTSSGSHPKPTLGPFSVAPTNNKMQQIIILPNHLMMPPKNATLPSKQPTVVITIVHNTGLQTAPTVVRPSHETPFPSVCVSTGQLLPIISSTPSVTFRDQQVGGQANSTICIITPSQSQRFILTTKQAAATSASSAVTQTNSTAVASHLRSLSQGLYSLSTQTTSCKVAKSSQKPDDTSPKQTIAERQSMLPKQSSETKQFTAASMSAPAAVSVTEPSDKPSPKQVKISNTMQPCASTASIQLMDFTPKDSSDPHLQTAKTPFPTQLAVKPKVEAPDKVSPNELPDSTVYSEKGLDTTSTVSLLRRPEVNTKVCMETETSTEDPEKFGSANVTEPFPPSSEKESVEHDIDSLNQNDSKASHIGFGQCEEDITSIKCLSEKNTVTSSINKDTAMAKNRKSTSLNPRRKRATRATSNPKNTQSTSMSPGRSSSTREGSGPRDTESTSMSPGRSSSTREGSGPRDTESTSMSPERSSSTREGSGPRDTESTSMSPGKSSATREGSGPRDTESTSMSPGRSSSTREGSGPRDTESTSVSPGRSSSTREGSGPRDTESTSVSPGRSSATREGSGPKDKESTSMSPGRSSSTRQGSGPRDTESTSMSPGRSSSTREGSGPRDTESTSMSPGRSSATREGSGPRDTESTSMSPGRSSSTRDYFTPQITKPSFVILRRICTISEVSNNTKLINTPSTGGNVESSKLAKPTSVSEKSTISSRVRVSPKSTISPHVSSRRTNSARRGSSPQKIKTNSDRPRISKNKSMIGDNRKCFIKGNANAQQNERKSSSVSHKRPSVTTSGTLSKIAKNDTSPPSITLLGKHGVSPIRTTESSPAKKKRSSRDCSGSKTNSRRLNAKTLAKAAKAGTIAKMSISKNRRKTNQVTEERAKCEAVKKITCKAVWIPPEMPVTVTPKKETTPPPVRPKPVRAPPMVSPLQPLMVIDGHPLRNQCGECGRLLSNRAALESHARLHRGQQPFFCTFCGKTFPDSKRFKAHARVHRNGRIHVCSQCGKGFVYRHGLSRHIQIAHSRIKPFVCQICNKGFFSKQDVETHTRSHTGEKPFHCNLCEKKFLRRVELNVHLRWHNGEKRHWCPQCGKGFLDYNNLKRHKLIHTGEKPYSCPHCAKCFTQSGSLKKHVKNVHKVM